MLLAGLQAGLASKALPPDLYQVPSTPVNWTTRL